MTRGSWSSATPATFLVVTVLMCPLSMICLATTMGSTTASTKSIDSATFPTRKPLPTKTQKETTRNYLINPRGNVSNSGPVQTGTNHSDFGKCAGETYSCRGRCQFSPRAACSCHWTCKIYGNCCEDFDEYCPIVDPEALGVLNNMLNSTTVQCREHNLLISSCSPSFDARYWIEMKAAHGGGSASDNTDEDTWWPRSVVGGMNHDDVRQSCDNSDSSSLSRMAPVSDTTHGLHFKNVFCALCNNVTNLSFWMGFANCLPTNNPNGTAQTGLQQNETTLASLLYETMGETVASQTCQIAWLPKEGSPNTCVNKYHLAHDVLDGEENTNDAPKPTTNNPSGNNDSADDRGNASVNVGGLNSNSTSDYTNVVDMSSNASTNADKCRSLLSLVQHPPNSGHIYQNMYCYLLAANNSTASTQLCEPSIPRLTNTSGMWFTLTQNASSPRGWAVIWEMASGIEEPYLAMLLDTDPDSGSEITDSADDTSFTLYITLEFDFERKGLIKGDFQEQVDRYTTRLLQILQTPPTNSAINCLPAISEDSSQISSHKYVSVVELKCEDLSRSVDTSVTPATNATDDITPGSAESKYTNFVTDSIQTLLSDKDAVTVPFTIVVEPCIVFPSDEFGRQRGICSQLKNVWRAVRDYDAIVGDITLEGIITIICCVLSDIGLLVRLALQNVVPFYKSYPGKIQFSLCLTLLFAYTLFLVGGMVEDGSMICKVIAILTHFAFLSALFWMNVTAFEIWRIFRHWRNQVVSRGNASLIASAFYAVGIPLAVVVTGIVLEELFPWSEFSPAYGESLCWINGTVAVATYFVGPCSFICCMNAVFVGLTLRGLRRQRTSISEFKTSNAMTAVTDTTIVVKIILLVGITWLLGVLAAVVDHQALWIIFTVINASLGFLISAVLVFNKRVFYAVQNKCLCYNTESLAVVSTQVARH